MTVSVAGMLYHGYSIETIVGVVLVTFLGIVLLEQKNKKKEK